jgi:hypothetical protein
MFTEILIGEAKRRFKPDPAKSIGKGGEADIYDIGNDQALKIFKTPDHPDYQGLPSEQEAAKRRIAEHQRKLPAFPTGLPARVVVPEELAYDKHGTIAGYAMQFKKGAEVLLRYGEIGFRQNGIADDAVTEIFKDLHQTLHGVHKRGVVVGDFNDLNVLIRHTEAYLIDADSSQFGPYLSRVFTEKFVDPLLCDPDANKLLIKKPHNEMSDWYAFAVMLMQSLLCLSGGPYGGVYKPKKPSARMAYGSRPLHRITVFHPDVRYPKPSRHFSILPDGLLQYFHEVFEKDKRGEIPRRLLEDLHWTRCSTCGLVHARGICPTCQAAIPQAVTAISTGRVSGERIFRTEGRIVFAASQNGTLRWLFHHNGEYRREDGNVVTTGALDPHARFRIRSADTVIARSNHAVIYSAQGDTSIAVDNFGLLPVVDANERYTFWVQNGQIKRTSSLGTGYVEPIGDALPQQTLIWAGTRAGFGFYRAGSLSQCFIFNTERRGINDSLTLKPFRGQLVDSTAVIGKEKIWFFVSSRVSGKTVNSCFLIRMDGTLEATAETEADDGSWLGTLRGKCAAGEYLLAPTDEGIVRIKPSGTTLVVEKEFPGTSRFVHAGRHLFTDKTGLMVVGSHEIWRLALT